MEKWRKWSLFGLRVSLGWLMLYAGVTKVIAPQWSAAGYLKGAKTFAGFYQWLAQPGMIGVTNFVNEWGLTLLGVSLILGIFVRLSSVLGALLMVLYWLPVLDFPKVEHGFLVDDHVVYAFVMLYFAAIKAGRVWGLDAKTEKIGWLAKNAKVREWLG